MISLTKLREFDLTAAAQRGRPSHLSAASGLARAGSFLYVVADDELHLGVFSSTGAKAGRLIKLFSGKLPASKAKRKARKPDLEVLTLLPAFARYPHGALFALGSGSKRNRCNGALLALDARGAVRGPPRPIDLAAMYATLNEYFSELNIEGAVVSGGELRLLQRGNKKKAQNAVVRFHLPPILDALGSGASMPPMVPVSVQSVDLGSIDGIALCFTDGAALPNGDILFTAIAENTEDNYQDGPCAGAAIGIADAKGKLRCLHRLDQPHKIEGVDAKVEGDVIRVLLVTDADDVEIPACLYSANISGYPRKFGRLSRKPRKRRANNQTA